MLIELPPYHVETDHIAAIKASGLDDEQTIVYVVGASVMDGGLLVDMDVDEVAEAIRTATYRALIQDLETEQQREAEQDAI